MKFNLENYENLTLESFGITGDFQMSDYSHYRWGWLYIYMPELKE